MSGRPEESLSILEFWRTGRPRARSRRVASSSVPMPSCGTRLDTTPGAVLYELLAGVLPPAGEYPTQVVPPSQFRQDVPPRLDMLIVSMLAADREDRPHSAHAVLGELGDIERTADLDMLIAGGESGSLEFKQTMRWDTKLQKRSTEVQRASMKTVCAFLNSGGGTLLIGVADTGKPTGLEDDLQDRDGAEVSWVKVVMP